MSGYESNRFVNLGEKVAKHLICSICLNIYNNPVLSDCVHTFCINCVHNWIKNNHTDCPVCRTEFTTRNRTTSLAMDSNLVIVSNFIFKYNLMAKGLINDFNIKCDNQSNGCEEVIELGSLSTHLKICEHWLCPKCEFIGRSEGHDCLELLKKDRNHLKVKLNEIVGKNSLLEEKIKTIKRSEVSANNKLRDIESRLESSEIKNRRLEKELKRIKSNNLLLDLKNDWKIEASEYQISNTISPESIYFGTHLTLYSKFSFDTKGFHFLIDSQNFLINFKAIEEIKLCFDVSFPAIIFRPNYQCCDEIREVIQLSEPSKGWFNVGSEDPKERYIIIKLCPGKRLNTNKCCWECLWFIVSRDIKYQSINSTEAKRMFNSV